MTLASIGDVSAPALELRTRLWEQLVARAKAHNRQSRIYLGLAVVSLVLIAPVLLYAEQVYLKGREGAQEVISQGAVLKVLEMVPGAILKIKTAMRLAGLQVSVIQLESAQPMDWITAIAVYPTGSNPTPASPPTMMPVSDTGKYWWKAGAARSGSAKGTESTSSVILIPKVERTSTGSGVFRPVVHLAADPFGKSEQPLLWELRDKLPTIGPPDGQASYRLSGMSEPESLCENDVWRALFTPLGGQVAACRGGGLSQVNSEQKLLTLHNDVTLEGLWHVPAIDAIVAVGGSGVILKGKTKNEGQSYEFNAIKVDGGETLMGYSRSEDGKFSIVVSDSGVAYCSDGSGDVWVRAQGELPRELRAVELLPSGNGDYLAFLGGESALVLAEVSGDGTACTIKANGPASTGVPTEVRQLQRFVAQGNALILAIGAEGARLSVDEGKSWQRPAGFKQDEDLWNLHIVKDSADIYVTSREGAVWRSSNSGRDWTEVSDAGVRAVGRVKGKSAFLTQSGVISAEGAEVFRGSTGTYHDLAVTLDGRQGYLISEREVQELVLTQENAAPIVKAAPLDGGLVGLRADETLHRVGVGGSGEERRVWLVTTRGRVIRLARRQSEWKSVSFDMPGPSPKTGDFPEKFGSLSTEPIELAVSGASAYVRLSDDIHLLEESRGFKAGSPKVVVPTGLGEVMRLAVSGGYGAARSPPKKAMVVVFRDGVRVCPDIDRVACRAEWSDIVLPDAESSSDIYSAALVGEEVLLGMNGKVLRFRVALSRTEGITQLERLVNATDKLNQVRSKKDSESAADVGRLQDFLAGRLAWDEAEPVWTERRNTIRTARAALGADLGGELIPESDASNAVVEALRAVDDILAKDVSSDRNDAKLFWRLDPKNLAELDRSGVWEEADDRMDAQVKKLSECLDKASSVEQHNNKVVSADGTIHSAESDPSPPNPDKAISQKQSEKEMLAIAEVCRQLLQGEFYAQAGQIHREGSFAARSKVEDVRLNRMELVVTTATVRLGMASVLSVLAFWFLRLLRYHTQLSAFYSSRADAVVLAVAESLDGRVADFVKIADSLVPPIEMGRGGGTPMETSLKALGNSLTAVRQLLPGQKQ